MSWVNLAIQIAVALIPGIILICYVYAKDRVEKEPIGLLIKALVGGVIAALAVIYLGGYLCDFINWLFEGKTMVVQTGDTAHYTWMYFLHKFLYYFIGVALVEESVKFFALVETTDSEREFNYLYDGMIYAIFVALGFAMFENVLYVLKFGVKTGILRAFTAVPGHMFDAVVMGYFYSRWFITKHAHSFERQMIRQGVIVYREPKIHLASMFDCVLWPTVIHGIYDFLCTVNTTWSMSVFVIFVIGLYFYGFSRIKAESRHDDSYVSYASLVVTDKYPEIIEWVKENDTAKK